MAVKKVIETEDHVKTKVVKPWYDKNLAWSFMPPASQYGKAGIPDRIGCLPVTITPEMVGMEVGLFVAVEAKSPKKAGTASARQEEKIIEIRQAAGVALVIGNEADLNVLETVLRSITHGQIPNYPVITIDKSRK